MCILLCGETTSGKSWILKPVGLVYPSAFAKPAKDSRYPLLNLELSEVILWQDFRMESCPMSWDDLLLLFEGETITIARPMNTFGSNLQYKATQPVFLTSDGPMEHPRRDARETAMMRRRFTTFVFMNTFQKAEVKRIEPCARCFAAWLTENEAPAPPAVALA